MGKSRAVIPKPFLIDAALYLMFFVLYASHIRFLRMRYVDSPHLISACRNSSDNAIWILSSTEKRTTGSVPDFAFLIRRALKSRINVIRVNGINVCIEAAPFCGRADTYIFWGSPIFLQIPLSTTDNKRITEKLKLDKKTRKS
jgi:hypothetical protein